MKRIISLIALCVSLIGCAAETGVTGGDAGESGVGVQQQELCTNPPVTSGAVGYISPYRYISGINPHPTQPYSLNVSWAFDDGTPGGTGVISFGASSGIVAKFGAACETPLDELTPGTGDCRTTNGWTSQGAGDEIMSINFPNALHSVNGQTVSVSRWMINGAKIMELWGTSTNSVSTWLFNDGITKIQSNGTGDTWLQLDGYNNGVRVTKMLNFHCGP